MQVMGEHRIISESNRKKSRRFIMHSIETKNPSPGREEPSLIRMGLAVFTLIVLPNSSDSFCRTQNQTDINLYSCSAHSDCVVFYETTEVSGSITHHVINGSCCILEKNAERNLRKFIFYYSCRRTTVMQWLFVQTIGRK